jgi:hypothetical protein
MHSLCGLGLMACNKIDKQLQRDFGSKVLTFDKFENRRSAGSCLLIGIVVFPLAEIRDKIFPGFRGPCQAFQETK